MIGFSPILRNPQWKEPAQAEISQNRLPNVKKRKDETSMKNAFLMLLLVLFASTSFAQTQGSTVRWRTIVGVIPAPNVANPLSSTSPIPRPTLLCTPTPVYPPS